MIYRIRKHATEPALEWYNPEKPFAEQHVEWAYLLGSDSPESRLRECDKHQLDVLHSCGITALTATVFGGDAKDVHCFIDRKNPAKGYNAATIERWKDYLAYWHSLGPQQVVAIMLSEWENHKEIPVAHRRELWREMVEAFYNFNVIWYFEEIPIGPGESIKPDEWREELRFLNGTIPEHHLVGLHNPTDQRHNDPWQWYAGQGLVDVALIQCPLRDVQAWTDKQTARGFAVIASEVSDPYGFGTHDDDYFREWCIAKGLSGGFAFLGPPDQSAVDHEKYRFLYEAVSNPSADDVGRIITPLNWRRAPWSTGTVERDMTIRVEPGQMASIETRAFIANVGNELTARFRIEGAFCEIRFRLIDEQNKASQESGPYYAGEHTIEVVTKRTGPQRICFDVLSFMAVAHATTVRITQID